MRLHHTVTAFLLLSTAALAMAPGPRAQGAPQEETGSIEGKVIFQSAKGEALKKAPRGIVGTDVVLYLVCDGQTPEAALSPPKTAHLDQVDITYVPHVLPIVAGATVEVTNSDSTTHNVHTYPKKNAAMNKSQAPSGKIDVVFEHPEIIHVGCDIHSQMSAYIVVVPNSHFTMAGKDGSFSLKNVPTGDYTLIAWHEKYGEVSQHVTVSAGAPANPTVTLKERARGSRRRGRN